MLNLPGGFDYHPHTRLVFGQNTIESLGELVKQNGGRRVLVVTDAGIARAGHAERARQAIAKAGLFTALFDRVQENPTTRNVSDCVGAAREQDIDFIVGLGGGSSMDTAKGANFILTNGGKMADYWGVNKATKAMLPLIAIPTTAGTGSECQSFALIADEHTHQKMACGDEKAYARVALLDPVLTLSQPPRVTANTGIDTVAHALEAHVTRIHSPISQLFSRESWRLAQQYLEVVLREPQNIEARGQMLIASAYGGLAIAHSMLGAAHSAANPLTAHFHIVHGQAVGMMLPFVIAFNSASEPALSQYADLASVAGLARHDDDPHQRRDILVARINELLRIAEIPHLSECSVPTDMIGTLSEEAAKQWTATFNPRPIGAPEFREMYTAALNAPRSVNAGAASNVSSMKPPRKG